MHKIIRFTNKYILAIKEINIVFTAILYLFCIERMLDIKSEYRNQS